MSGDVPYRRLRILLVDDNRINLSVLSTLLKRRFGNLLDGQPVSVDSGLKAIQLLRTNVFDCILMDIQMPFLSGLDASIRIRNGEDGVLEANRDAHIVAVTTAVGDEPELAYRRAGMDGMIGKPVRFQDMQHYICPLAHEAFNAAPSVESISIQGEDIMPPLPPTHSRSKRLFYLPANATIRAPQPDICRGADFEKMLRAQTRASLRKGGAIAIARTGTWSAGRRHENQDTEKNDQAEEIIVKSPLSVKAPELIPSVESESEGLSEVNPDLRGREVAPSPTRPKHSRNSSLTINKRTLSQQIQREMENMEGHLSDLSDSGTVKRREQKAVNRPAAIHRTSSPAWLVTQAQSEDDKVTEATIVSPTSPLYLSPDRLRNSRPDWLLSMKARSPLNSSRVSSVDSSSSSGRLSSLTGSDTEEYVAPSLTSDSHGWISRRDSQRSNGSCISDVSTDLPTPANELPSWPTSSLITLDGNNTKHIHRLSSSSSSTIDPWSSDDSESEKLKKNFNLNNVNKQDDCLAQDVQNFNLTITRG